MRYRIRPRRVLVGHYFRRHPEMVEYLYIAFGSESEKWFEELGKYASLGEAEPDEADISRTPAGKG